MAEVTVLMAVRNGEPYLRAAVESILNQTYREFEFLIIDDASTDNTREIVRSYGDSRIQLLCLKKNIGQTAALNLGLKEVSTEWIARMDADDFSAPLRLARQMEVLKADSSLGCVGTFGWAFRDDPSATESVMSRPVSHSDIMAELLWSAPLIHTSIVARTRTMVECGGYNERYRYSADLDLYDRLFKICRAANIPELLTGVRQHAAQDSHSAKAVRESIDIFHRRLLDDAYTQRERSVIRFAISLHEALCAKLESRRVDIVKHVLRAFVHSPMRTVRHFLPK